MLCKYCHLKTHLIDKCPTIICKICRDIGHPQWLCTKKKEMNGKKHDDKNVKSISTYLCQLSHRLPLDLWDIAIKTFEEIKIQKKDQQKNNNNFQKSLLSVD
jgi:hypothetical protein